MTGLPEAFLQRMKEELQDEYEDFAASYEDQRVYGLRANTLKCPLSDFQARMPFTLEKVSWADEGFYYREEERPGKHPYHEAGAYYIQEPSAMSAVQLLDPKPGDRVLDLCAAPGGKSSQIAGRLLGKGLLISNEIMPDRARILAQNIERMGIRNCLVTNEDSGKLSNRFIGFFDKILVDAPCSGEGMFRKDENARAEWSPENVLLCAKRQAEILDNAALMLRAGGILVYSTCTFSKAEDEESVEAFLKRHPDFSLETMDRIWPHKQKGEGHFIARLSKKDGMKEDLRPDDADAGPGRAATGSFLSMESAGSRTGVSLTIPEKAGKKSKKSFHGKGGRQEEALGDFKATIRNGRYVENDRWSGKTGGKKETVEVSEESLKTFLTKECGIRPETVEGLFQAVTLNIFGENIYLTPAEAGSLSGLTVVRPGLQIAVNKGDRLEPAHALMISLRPEEVSTKLTVDLDGAKKFLAGESLPCPEDLKGWTAVFTNGFSLGFGKAAGGCLKNHYPKGLRVLL